MRIYAEGVYHECKTTALPGLWYCHEQDRIQCRVENGTGYYDNAVVGKHAPRLEPGVMVKSKDTKGRQLLLIGTHIGNVVIFDRYSDPESTVVVWNAPTTVMSLMGALVQLENGSLSPDGIANLTGSFYYKDELNSVISANIGKNMEDMFEKLLSKA